MIKDKCGNTLKSGEFLVQSYADGEIKFARVVKCEDELELISVVKEWNRSWRLTKQYILRYPNKCIRISSADLPLEVFTLLTQGD